MRGAYIVGFVWQAELRPSVFEATEEEDRLIENNEGLLSALLGSCNDRARQLHALPQICSGNITILGAVANMILNLTFYRSALCMNTYAHQKDSWKSELNDFSSNHGYELNRNGDSGPLLLDVLEGFLKFESLTQTMGGNSRSESEIDSSSSLDSRNPPH
ncbi:unnamed protein product [Eruca vesicaria subsp. sativa]|uniref:Uncharacterized protein n=1 Tax=Eruca vesicaria subsp. sativa TaxID=29727 RepID=A0ABC8JHT1_ERUVS|nr:unnamed protein product [Eruca vesicaria subsp. sativa]